MKSYMINLSKKTTLVQANWPTNEKVSFYTGPDAGGKPRNDSSNVIERIKRNRKMCGFSSIRFDLLLYTFTIPRTILRLYSVKCDICMV